MTLAALGVFVAGFSTIATGINIIATVHTLRASGLIWWRLPLFVWSLYATAIIMVLGMPALDAALLMIVAERVLDLGLFDPRRGGDPILFQHVFWFYSHPAVYIMILPGFGVVTEVIACFTRRRVFGYTAMVYALLTIALVRFFVWGHHMFTSGRSAYASLTISFLSFVIAVPSAIKVFNWRATLYRGQMTFEAPMVYALGFIGLFTLGGLSGLFLATPSPSTSRRTTPTSSSRMSTTSWSAASCRRSSSPRSIPSGGRDDPAGPHCARRDGASCARRGQRRPRLSPLGGAGAAAFVIAAAMALLIATMFMAVHRAAKVTRLAALTGAIAIAVEIAMIVSDMLTRSPY